MVQKPIRKESKKKSEQEKLGENQAIYKNTRWKPLSLSLEAWRRDSDVLSDKGWKRFEAFTPQSGFMVESGVTGMVTNLYKNLTA